MRTSFIFVLSKLYWTNLDAAQLLLSYEETEVDSMNLRGFTPLCAAAEWGWNEIIQMLVPAGANVNHYPEQDPDGRTPLKFAAMWGDSDTVQVPLRTWGAQMVHLPFSFGVLI